MSSARAMAATCWKSSTRVDVGDDPVERRELGERHRAEGRLPRQDLGDDVEHLVVGRRGRLDREVVDAEEVLGPLPVRARHPQQPPLELVAEPRAGLVEQLVVVQGLAGGRQPEPLGVEHGAHEERPLGEHVGNGLADEHPLRVEPVRPPGRRGVREDERLPAHPGRGVGEVDDVERPRAEHPFAEGQGRVTPRAVAVLPREVPSGDGDRTGCGLHHEVEGQVARVGRGEPLDDLGGQQLGGAPARTQRDVGARFGARLRWPATRHTCRRRGPPTARCGRCPHVGSSP